MTSDDIASDPRASIELVEETASLEIRKVITGRVRVATQTELRDEVLRRELHGTRVEMERVPIDRMLEPGEAPAVARTEGAVTIIPIYEEVVVTETRIVLKEELHITQYETTDEVEIPVTLRRQVATIERSTSED
ncbi:uncharacterized protein DUF2382 [Palleronia aestuarii]|uniref:Uncharacterized protein DUF2382 n=1 Tax=Palleronia aestuarii TaxID=568105 RepID=A0A2W7N271_9RHOB|nr:DUF2382 domain-containing protein [Palleronia aestuarii]PZX14198.1 uncharacterized protein DUF2382 [Palleronia aestuarii]